MVHSEEAHVNNPAPRLAKLAEIYAGAKDRRDRAEVFGEAGELGEARQECGDAAEIFFCEQRAIFASVYQSLRIAADADPSGQLCDLLAEILAPVFERLAAAIAKGGRCGP